MKNLDELLEAHRERKANEFVCADSLPYQTLMSYRVEFEAFKAGDACKSGLLKVAIEALENISKADWNNKRLDRIADKALAEIRKGLEQ